MRHYLLTWYGMTDLRSALGLEETDGPVLSALKTGDYSDVVILAYTSPGKQQHAFVGPLREEWEEWVTAPTSERPLLSRDQVHRFVDALSNTDSGHEVFTEWLRSELTALGVVVEIQVIPVELRHLNDAPGIYAAAAAAVRVALDDPVDKRVTTYVSPGTPVMAYTWALIARSNPQLNIGVISSSDPRLPPERVELPQALLDSGINGSGGAEHRSRDYDLVIHLLGEQNLPVFFGMRQFETVENLILTTKEYEAEARRLSRVAGFAPTPVIVPDPFKPADTRRAILKQVNKLSADAVVAVNMTGGTKLMFAGALSACWELGLDPFYFEIRHHNVIFLRDGTQIPFAGISDVEDFLKAAGFTTVRDGRWPDQPEAIKNRRQSATHDLWIRRDALRGLYKDKAFLAFSDRWNRHYPKRERDSLPFSFSWNGGEVSVDTRDTPNLVLKDAPIEVPKEDFFPFLAGGWLEEYVYSLLRPLEHEGIVRDVRVGFEAGYREGSTSKPEWSAQEFDGAFTDGKRLWIVECKAGPVRQEAIQKLENNLKLYGGVAARGLLISSFPLNEANKNRLGRLSAITAVPPDELSTETLRRVVLRA